MYAPWGHGSPEEDNYHVWPKQNNPNDKQIWLDIPPDFHHIETLFPAKSPKKSDK